MSFWDTSALLALLADEPFTEMVQEKAGKEGATVWWGARVEAVSGICRLRREGKMGDPQFHQLITDLGQLVSEADEVEPSESLRNTAEGLLRMHPLRAADALQLAAALTWADHKPVGRRFVSLDKRLREAAMQEGFLVLPEDVE